MLSAWPAAWLLRALRDSEEAGMSFLWQALVGLPGWLLIGAAKCYQWLVSPLLGTNCRFQPTCSQYFRGAVQKYGALRGSWRGLQRVARCHPWSAGGFDPP